MRRTLRGFTLVELLVVIGIIALLVSILLPALNKARGQANLIKCEANLRSIGQMLLIYSNQNRGYAPYGSVTGQWDNFTINYSYSGSPPPAPWLWPDTLSLIFDRSYNKIPGYVNNADHFNGAFVDVDTVTMDGGDKRVSHYTANPRIMPGRQMYDPITNGYYQLRRIAVIKRSADVFCIWDGPQVLDPASNGGAPAIADSIDSYQSGYGHGLSNPAANSWFSQDLFNNRIGLGVTTSSLSAPSKATIQAVNVDLSPSNQYNPPCQMRFRHQKNTMGNFLAIDGHVESRQVGDVYVRDIAIPQ